MTRGDMTAVQSTGECRQRSRGIRHGSMNETETDKLLQNSKK